MILDIGDANRTPVTPLKLQKLVYFAHGWNLGINHKPLIDEMVEAWKFGPVVPSLYHEFKGYGNSPIRTRAVCFNNGLIRNFPGDDDYTKVLLDWVWKNYGHYSSQQLSAMTHAPDTPWSEAWNSMGDFVIKGKDIPNEAIERYFAKELDKIKSNG